MGHFSSSVTRSHVDFLISTKKSLTCVEDLDTGLIISEVTATRRYFLARKDTVDGGRQKRGKLLNRDYRWPQSHSFSSSSKGTAGRKLFLQASEGKAILECSHTFLYANFHTFSPEDNNFHEIRLADKHLSEKLVAA